MNKTLFSIPTKLFIPATLFMTMACGPEPTPDVAVDQQDLTRIDIQDRGSRLQDFSRHRNLGRALENRVHRLRERQRPHVSPPPTRAPRMLEWTRRDVALRDLQGEVFEYWEDREGVPNRLYRVMFSGRLYKVAVLNERDGRWLAMAKEPVSVLGDGVGAPITLHSVQKDAIAEIEDCALFLDELRFDCAVGGSAKVSMYTAEVLEAGDPAPTDLGCMEYCPSTAAAKPDPYFQVPQDAHLLGAEERVFKYTYNTWDLRLTHDGDEVRAPAAADGRIVSGFMFEYTEENLARMACGFEDQMNGAQSCVWRPLERFYTWSTETATDRPPRVTFQR